MASYKENIMKPIIDEIQYKIARRGGKLVVISYMKIKHKFFVDNTVYIFNSPIINKG